MKFQWSCWSSKIVQKFLRRKNEVEQSSTHFGNFFPKQELFCIETFVQIWNSRNSTFFEPVSWRDEMESPPIVRNPICYKHGGTEFGTPMELQRNSNDSKPYPRANQELHTRNSTDACEILRNPGTRKQLPCEKRSYR